jgi:hypothetical protein
MNSLVISETVEKPFNGVILSEAKNLTKHSFETLHGVYPERDSSVAQLPQNDGKRRVQGEIVDIVNNLSLKILLEVSRFR